MRPLLGVEDPEHPDVGSGRPVHVLDRRKAPSTTCSQISPPSRRDRSESLWMKISVPGSAEGPGVGAL